MFEETTTISYNEQGDMARERKTFKMNSILPMGPSYSFSFDADSNPIVSNSAPESPERPGRDYMPQDFDVRYAYRYDSHGNWIEKIETRSDGFSVATHREITYYWAPEIKGSPPKTAQHPPGYLFTPTGTRRGQDYALAKTCELQSAPQTTRIRPVRPVTVSQSGGE